MSSLMIHVSFVIQMLHLNLLQFKYLITINFLLCLHTINIMDMPMCSVAYVHEVTWLVTLLTFGIDYEYKTNCSSNIFPRCLIN